ncbi:uncharacterized protein LOC110458418 [Mizuhopecten yessoensis]|uniref:uncharacterized protein LOC110458418 n=1 Tax=Mizuhopecten yessoensis TaxID=6573 RepID=UPI000B4577E9|nr:uncharacterized protein LOC110458418 [Mizuhopecten yessoensis]
MKVQKSCTENLQNFHKPKFLYDGKPIATENIPTKRKFSNDILQDPRPHKYRNNHGFTDFVRNMMINYCASSSQDIAMRYLHPSADIQAAALDHDYFPLPFTEYLVDNALQVTEDTATEIQESTKLQAKSSRWFMERQWRLTASRFGDITHATNRRNMTKLCESIHSSKVFHSKSIEHGKKYETKALKKFQETTQLPVQRCGLFVNSKCPYLGASPDGIINNDTIIEIKCPYAGRNCKIAPGKLFSFLISDSKKKMYLNCYSKYYDQNTMTKYKASC